MCGITGILHFDRERIANRNVLKDMNTIISHRGPDGEGYYLKNNVALGHRRLSIIDLSTGHQPMFNDDKSIVLVFNGEIYNYIELRDQLKKFGYHFSTSSDTEVIIKAYEFWGIDCQNKFNGMWSFALWDVAKQQLFLSRDRVGEKPLHYAVYDNSLVFGSEIKSILAYGVPKILDTELLDIYLTLSYIPAPYTFFKNIKKLKPGHCLIICGSDIKEQIYWDLPEIDEENMLVDSKSIYEEFENLLTDSVKIRMRSDVPYGAFLSGGLDSSSIVSIMSKTSSFPVETFTIGFKEKKYDERNLAAIVARKFNTNHHEYVVEPDTFEESLSKISYHYDEPFGDSSAIPTGFVSRFAATKVKMVLTGDGGDEVMSGYTTFQGEKFAGQYQKLPRWIKDATPTLLSQIAKPFKGSLRYKLNRAHDVCYSANLDFLSRYISKISWMEHETIQRLISEQKTYPAREFVSDVLNKCSYKDPFYKLMFLNLKLSLPDDMLTKVDRMSMAYSLETRTPFLDYRLIEYLVNVDKKVKMKKYERKSILRNSIGKSLPKELLSAPKKGFTVPLREWFKGDSFDNKLENLANNPLLDKEAIKYLISLNNAGKKDYGNFIWMLINLNKQIHLTAG